MRGQRLLLLFDACAITCRSFYCAWCWGDLTTFRNVLVFSPALLSPFVFITLLLSLLLLLLSVITVIIISTELLAPWAGAGYGWRGSWLVAGRAGFWVLLLPGLGSAAPAPRFLGTQPPRATQAF